MRFSFRKSLAISFLALFVLNGCATTASSPALITADPGNAHIRSRLEFHMNDLEKSISKSYKGKTVHIAAPIAASYQDWRKMPVARIRGREQGGLTSWNVLGGSTSVYLAHWKGVVPDWLIRHEALHVILLSHGITGHPAEYAPLFGHPYWWLPEEFFLKRNKAKMASTPNANGELEAACSLCMWPSGSLRNRRP